MPVKFIIAKNECLTKETIGYYNTYYTGMGEPNNPDFLNVLKNDVKKNKTQELKEAQCKVIDILVADLPIIIRECMSGDACICMGVPRAKALSNFVGSQLMFLEGIKKAVSDIKRGGVKVEDGTDYIVRHTDTRTTHMRRGSPWGYQNHGEWPYTGITKDTCRIVQEKITSKKIILIDDIYTKNVNIDEDCIQALYDNGAKSVIFYAIALTKGK